MMMFIIIELVIVLILMMLSALFSGSETAYTSIDDVTLLRLVREKKLKEEDKKFWHNSNYSFIPSMLVGNNIVNIVATSLVTVLAIKISGLTKLDERLTITVITFMFTITLIIFGEIFPKTLMIIYAEKSIPKLIVFMKVCFKIFSPLTFVLNKITSFIIDKILPKRVKNEKRGVVSSMEDIASIINLGHKEGIIKENTHDLLTGVIDFRSKSVEDIMIPRVDMHCVESETPIPDIIALAVETGHSRFPVYEETVDHIIGILHTKFLFKSYLKENKKDKKAIDFIMLPYFVPETKPISRLFTEMQKQKLQMVIAIDEYGGTAGLVSMEDIVEEIMGDIEDESDKEEEFIMRRGHRLIVNGLAPLDEINEKLKLELYHEEYQTIAGYVLETLGHIPDTNERFVLSAYNVRIRKMDDRRIVELEFTPIKKYKDDVDRSNIEI